MPSRTRPPEAGQALPLMLVVVTVVLAGVLVLTAFGQALGGRSRLQRGTDLAAMSAARTMRADYPRLFEPAVLPNGAPNPHHLSTAAYLGRARSAAVDGGRRNGVRIAPWEVDFPGARFAPTRVRVRARGEVHVRVDGSASRRRRRVPVRARRGGARAHGGARPPGVRIRGRLQRTARLSAGKAHGSFCFRRCRAAFRRCAPFTRERASTGPAKSTREISSRRRAES